MAVDSLRFDDEDDGAESMGDEPMSEEEEEEAAAALPMPMRYMGWHVRWCAGFDELMLRRVDDCAAGCCWWCCCCCCWW